MYLLLSQRGPVEVAVSVLCKGWTVSAGTGPKVQPAHRGCEGKRDGIGWLDGLSDLALAPGPHIFMCPSCLSLSCDPCPTSCAHASAARHRGDSAGHCLAPTAPQCAAGFTR